MRFTHQLQTTAAFSTAYGVDFGYLRRRPRSVNAGLIAEYNMRALCHATFKIRAPQNPSHSPVDPSSIQRRQARGGPGPRLVEHGLC